MFLRTFNLSLADSVTELLHAATTVCAEQH